MTHFSEAQKFSPFIWLAILPVALLTTVGAYQQLILDRPFGDSPMPDSWMIAIWLIFGVGLTLLFFLLELRTEVREDGVHARFFPLPAFKSIRFDQVERSYVREYRPIMEYGGWGLRYSRHGTAYNMRGKRGVQFELKNGKKILIGSQEAEALQRAVEQGMR